MKHLAVAIEMDVSVNICPNCGATFNIRTILPYEEGDVCQTVEQTLEHSGFCPYCGKNFKTGGNRIETPVRVYDKKGIKYTYDPTTKMLTADGGFMKSYPEEVESLEHAIHKLQYSMGLSEENKDETTLFIQS
jgi:hypothetical protein